MPLPPKLDKEVIELGKHYQIEVIEDTDTINLIIKDFPIGNGYSLPVSDLLVRTPRSYPDAGPDMFWTLPGLTLQNGAIPEAAQVIETYLGRAWRRFSWHGPPWRSSIHNMHSFIEFIRRRLKAQR